MALFCYRAGKFLKLYNLPRSCFLPLAVQTGSWAVSAFWPLYTGHQIIAASTPAPSYKETTWFPKDPTDHFCILFVGTKAAMLFCYNHVARWWVPCKQGAAVALQTDQFSVHSVAPLWWPVPSLSSLWRMHLSYFSQLFLNHALLLPNPSMLSSCL